MTRSTNIEMVLWLFTCMLFLAGISLPMFSFQKFFIFNDSFSLLGGVVQLFSEGEWFLFLIIFSFSIAVPLYKLFLCLLALRTADVDPDKKTTIVRRLAALSKWSMADVFVVAVIASTVKLGMIATIKIHIGLFVFCLAVLSSMLLVQRQMSGYELRPIEKTT